MLEEQPECRDDAFARTAYNICRWHHERYDGGGYPEAERYFTSGMTRTEQTFAALYGDRPHGTLPGMQEMRFGEFEGKTYADLKDDPAFRAWCSGDYENNVCPGGESWNGLTDRALQALAPILAQGKDTVIVAHGGTQMAALSRFAEPHRDYYDWNAPLAGGFVLDAAQWPERRVLRVVKTVCYMEEKA